jgi:hypothetical protein
MENGTPGVRDVLQDISPTGVPSSIHSAALPVDQVETIVALVSPLSTGRRISDQGTGDGQTDVTLADLSRK